MKRRKKPHALLRQVACSALFLPALCLLPAACARRAAVVPALPGALHRLAGAPITFGTGLSTAVTLLYVDSVHERDFCQTPGNGFGDCPSYAMGKKSVSHSAKGSGSDPAFGAIVTYDQFGNSSLGSDEYDEHVSVASKKPTLDSSAGQQQFGWEDVLHVNSKTLPSTTPVKIWLELSVAQSKSAVSCKYDPTAWFDFSATGLDKIQPYLEVTGKCVNGTFTYALDNGSGPKGTKAEGWLNTNVDAAIEISGVGHIRLHACQLVTSCAKSYASEIAGKVTWRILKVSPARVSLTTDSGTNYR